MKIKRLLYITTMLYAFSFHSALASEKEMNKDRSGENLQILVNQLGYLPGASKIALLSSNKKETSGKWQLQNTDTGKIIESGKISSAVLDKKTQIYTHKINFSGLDKPGTYRLKFNKTRSVEFPIAKAPYDKLLVSLLRSYYLQRCGIKIIDEITGIKKEICHLEDGVIAHDDGLLKEFTKVSAPGGWHDAGDYGKYVTTTAAVNYELLSRYERYQQNLQKLKLDIPKSHDSLPDFLEEMKVGLDWMLKMQREDGAVYRKLSGKKWPEIVSPDKDTQTRLLYGVSSPETAKAAAAWAIAARVYVSFDQKLAENYLNAAQLANDWLDSQTEMVFDYHKGDDKGSGPYRSNKTDIEESLKVDSDDQFAAHTEMYLTTGQSHWKERIAQEVKEQELNLFEWKNVAAQSMLNLLWHKRANDLLDVRNEILEKLENRASLAYKRVQKNAFDVANDRIIWGSNKMTAEEGVLLIHAAIYLDKPEYRDAAWEQFHFLLGRNPFNQTFVTGFGERPVKNLHHIFATAENLEIPGLLVGGANELAQAGEAPKQLGLLSYADSKKSYATNEYAIDYNSALISLILDLHNLKPKN